MSDWVTALSAQAFSTLLFLPYAIPLVIRFTAITKDNYGRWGNQWVLIFLGFWLLAFQMALYILQYFFNTPRPNPFDQTRVYYGCPSEIGFYTSVAVTFIIEFTLVWNIRFSIVYWAELILFLIVPPSILIWVGFNTWQEVLLSMGLGILAITLFVLAVRFYFMHELPFMLSCAPWTWFSCVDTWIQTRQGQEETEYIRRCSAQIKRLVPRPTGLQWLLHSLY